MAKTAVFPASTWAVGVRTSPSVAIPLGASRITVSFDVTPYLDGASFIRFGLEISLDGGTSWAPLHAAGRPGGSLLRSDGLPYDVVGYTADLPEPSNPNRRARAWLNVSGAPAVLGSGSVEIT